MSTTPIPKNRSSSPTVFEQQRAELVREIAVVGNEFGSVEALWSQFENFMGRPGEEHEAGEGGRQKAGAGAGAGAGGHHQDEEQSQLHEEDR
ncbi:hypothetical protein AbraCBS73388_000802 [Aspergillus brasiliensis]|uniref:DASH complex subunit DAD1 n=1 Tax=Aspergillus brasiliensis TaxID=319629 RepID=A0A9W5YYL8_9EURO|nr:hypothetical protein AbraCBS73388_000802 [Aspergillus brasiliensis]